MGHLTLSWGNMVEGITPLLHRDKYTGWFLETMTGNSVFLYDDRLRFRGHFHNFIRAKSALERLYTKH